MRFVNGSALCAALCILFAITAWIEGDGGLAGLAFMVAGLWARCAVDDAEDD